jgi:hypothetical protein
VGKSVLPAPPPAALDLLTEDIARLYRSCSAEEFCRALQWLCDVDVLHRATHVGTGPFNRGKKFDVFYLKDMWRTQIAICKIITDIYRRGLIERLQQRQLQTNKPPPPPPPPPQTIDDFNNMTAFREQARWHLRALIRREREHWAAVDKVRAATTPERVSELTARDADAAEDGTALPRIGVLHRCVTEYYAQHAEARAGAPIDDVYSDMLGQESFRLLRESSDAEVEARIARSNLSEEQREGVRHVLQNPITIFMAPGGCGKTHAVEWITKCFSLDQIAVCALTAKACEVLKRTIGKVSTIHSLIVRWTLYQQAKKRHDAMVAGLQKQLDTLPIGERLDERRAFLAARIDIERRTGLAEIQSPLRGVRVIIVDEMSLTDDMLFRRLLEIVHPSNQPPRGPGNDNTGQDNAVVRLLLLGDVKQLGSIAPGALLDSLCRALPHCVRTFHTNFRSRGKAIFRFARDIVLRKPHVARPDYSEERNHARLSRSPLPTNTTPDEVAAAEDASIVFIDADKSNMARRLREVLGYLGAFTVTRDLVTRATHEARAGIHIITPTNALARDCNTFVREFYFGARMSPDEGRYAFNTPAMNYKLVRGDKIYFRQNFKYKVLVSAEAIIEAAESEGRIDENGNVMDSALSTVPADEGGGGGGDEEELINALNTDKGRAAVEILNREMALAGVTPPSANGMRTVFINFHNSEIVTLLDFYNTPRRQTPGLRCLCEQCPAPKTKDEATQPQPCVRWPHVVPPRRRMLNERVIDFGTIQWHDHGMSGSNGNSNYFRRMAVFRTATQQFKQLSVEQNLTERALWDYGFATTVHRYQGSGARTVIIVMPYDSTFVDMAMAYTAFTRAEERVVFIGSPRAWSEIVARDAPLRRTELWFMLAQTVAQAHRKIGERFGFDAAHAPYALADALGATGVTERELLRIDRRVSEAADVGMLWAAFDVIARESMRRAGINEL